MKFKYLVLLFFIPTTAFAQFSENLAVDAPPRELIGVSNGALISLRTSNSSSYCCAVNRTGGASNTAEITTFDNFNSIVPVARGVELPAVSNNENRYCWIDEFAFPGLYSSSRAFGLGNISSTANVEAWCEDTSLFGNYNTSVSDFNFLEITARTSSTNSTVSGKIKLKSSVSGQVRNLNFNLTVGEDDTEATRVDISIHDLLGNVGDFGDVKITHDGAPGQVSAKLSQYDITSTAPLNFTLVGQEVFRKASAK